MSNFNYQRTIHFADTDAAGVVYFSNLLSICHEAYEAFLAIQLNLNLSIFFQDKSTAIPIIHADIDFLQPLFCGDRIDILVFFKLVNNKVFEINYQVIKDKTIVANALTRHICIDPQLRKSKLLPNLFINLKNQS